MLQIGQRVQVLCDVTLADEADLERTIPGPCEGRVSDVDVRERVSIYWIELDAGGVFLFEPKADGDIVRVLS